MSIAGLYFQVMKIINPASIIKMINVRKQSIKNWPETERPREKLIKNGAETLSDGELLAILLRVGNKGQSAEALGRELLDKFKGLSGIDRGHIEELLKISGLGIAKSAQIKAAIEIGKRVRTANTKPVTFDNAENVAEYSRPRFEGKRHELFLVLLLDGRNHLLAERIIAEGIPTQANVYIRRIMEEALRSSASSFVVIHNHPSGDFTPSSNDIEITQRLKKAAEILELVFVDHIIISDKGYYSFSDDENILS